MLHAIRLAPVPLRAASALLVANHYLHSLPGGTLLAFGVFIRSSLCGAITLGVGPINAHRLVDGAAPGDIITLTRLWLADRLPRNSESRVLGMMLRELRRHTALRLVLSYSDPAAGHVGTIYQATGWLYTGLSAATPLYDLGDGVARHSRTFGHSYGTRSVAHLRAHGIGVRLVAQSRKHRYIYPLDPNVQDQLTVPILPYPKPEVSS